MAEQLLAQWQELLPGKDFKKLVPSLVQDITNFVNTVNEGVPLLCSPHPALPLLSRALTACARIISMLSPYSSHSPCDPVPIQLLSWGR